MAATMLKQRLSSSMEKAMEKCAELTEQLIDTGAKHQYTFVNDLPKQVRILLEEDPDGMMQAAINEIDNGIPCVGDRLIRQKKQIQEAYERIYVSGKPFQEFTMIQDQMRTVNMKSPIVRCSIGICEWNGASLKLVQVKSRLVSSGDLAVSVNSTHDTTRGKLIRSDTLEQALMSMGLQVGFTKPESQELEAKVSAAMQPPAPLTSRGIPSADLTLLGAPSRALPAFGREVAKPQMLPGLLQAKPPPSVPHFSPTPQRSSVPEGFLPTNGSVKVYSKSRGQWIEGVLVGVGLGTSPNSPAGAVCVQYELAPGQYTQKVLLPEQFRDSLRMP